MTPDSVPLPISDELLAVVHRSLSLLGNEVESLSDWCVEVGELLDEERDEDDDGDEDDDVSFEAMLVAAVGPLEQVVAVSPSGSWWALLVPMGPWTGRGAAMAGTVLVIRESDEPRIADWAAIRADDRLWLDGDGAVICGDWSGIRNVALAFNASSWERTTANFAFGSYEAVLRLNGEEVEFDVGDVDLRYWRPATAALPEGLLIEVTSNGESMSTGEIGLTISVDENAALWVSMWGYADVYVGRPDEACTPLDAIELAIDAAGEDAEQPIDDVCMIRSEILGVEEMRVAVERILDRDINVGALDDVEVQCVGFEGTAGDLLGSGQ